MSKAVLSVIQEPPPEGAPGLILPKALCRLAGTSSLKESCPCWELEPSLGSGRAVEEGAPGREKIHPPTPPEAGFAILFLIRRAWKCSTLLTTPPLISPTDTPSPLCKLRQAFSC